MRKIFFSSAEWLFTLKWAMANTVGWVVGGTLMVFLLWLYFPLEFSALQVLRKQSIASIILGGCIGLPTVLAIRPQINRPLLWIGSLMVALCKRELKLV